MSDAEHKRAQLERLQGEGAEHFMAKQRLANILRSHHYYVELEHRVRCSVWGLDDEIEHRSDVLGVSGARILCCEINGKGGHKSKQSFEKDNLKQRRIGEVPGYEGSEFFTFSWKDLLGKKAWTDEEVCSQMKI